MVKISASILDCNFLHLKEELKAVLEAGVDAIHLDIMDGHFVPNLSFGVPIARAVHKWITQPTADTRQPTAIYAHLMVIKPEIFIDRFAPYADFIIFHIEATEKPDECFNQIHAAGKNAGISLNPDTPIESLKPFLTSVKDVLIMSVYPGFGGQKFIPETIERIRFLHHLRREIKGKWTISVDGGVNPDNCRDIIQSGADILIAGSAIFKSPDYRKTVRRLKCLTS
ncbi:MAG: ribulose-phosphate 3-epimerase [candidate division WOR-3 bacterium]